MYHDTVLNRLFRRVIDELPEFQYYAWDDEREEVVGVGNAIPAAWDGDIASLPDGGVDAVVEAGFAEGAPTPTVLCALQILIAPDYRGQGLSSRMIERMGVIGRRHGLETLIAPVRPNLKHRYPLAPIERYIDVAPRRRRARRPVAANPRKTRSQDRQGRSGVDACAGVGLRLGGMD